MICLGKRELLGDPASPVTCDDFLTRCYVLERNAALVSENLAAAILFVNSGEGVILGTGANLAYGAYDASVIDRLIVESPIKRSLYLCERRDTPISAPWLMCAT